MFRECECGTRRNDFISSECLQQVVTFFSSNFDVMIASLLIRARNLPPAPVDVRNARPRFFVFFSAECSRSGWIVSVGWSSVLAGSHPRVSYFFVCSLFPVTPRICSKSPRDAGRFFNPPQVLIHPDGGALVVRIYRYAFPSYRMQQSRRDCEAKPSCSPSPSPSRRRFKS